MEYRRYGIVVPHKVSYIENFALEGERWALELTIFSNNPSLTYIEAFFIYIEHAVTPTNMASHSMWTLTLFLYFFATQSLWHMCCAFVLPPMSPMMQTKRFYLINDEQPAALQKTAIDEPQDIGMKPLHCDKVLGAGKRASLTAISTIFGFLDSLFISDEDISILFFDGRIDTEE